MADRRTYAVDGKAYKNVVTKNNEYIRTHYHRTAIKVSQKQREAWQNQSVADGADSLKDWILSVCTNAPADAEPVAREKIGKDFVFVNINLKDDEYNLLQEQAEQAGLSLSAWIKQCCDLRIQ